MLVAGRPDAAVPVLFMRLKDGRLWEGGKDKSISILSPQAIALHRAALRERLAKDARTRWGGMSAYIQEEGATLPIEASPYQTGRLGPRENLLAALHAADRLLVLGEPGSGKTVALERLAWELCADRSEAVGADRARIGAPLSATPAPRCGSGCARCCRRRATCAWTTSGRWMPFSRRGHAAASFSSTG